MKIFLIEPYKKKDLNQISQVLHCMNNLEMNVVVDSYKQLRVEAPQRRHFLLNYHEHHRQREVTE